MFLLLLGGGVSLVALLVLVVFWTFRAITVRRLSPWYLRLAASAVVLGAVCGFVSGVAVRWRTSADVCWVGFPIPGMVLVYENGRWVDYVGPTVLICPFLNALLFATVFVLPVSLTLLARRQHHLRAEQDGAGGCAGSREAG